VSPNIHAGFGGRKLAVRNRAVVRELVTDRLSLFDKAGFTDTIPGSRQYSSGYRQLLRGHVSFASAFT
jgi:hypothetical protein